MSFYGHLRSWPARACFAAHQFAGKVRAPDAVSTALRRGVGGIYRSPDMTLRLRPGTWDAWTAHPGHEAETHAWISDTFTGGHMIDVGAYCGSFSLRYAKRFDRITALEAMSENFAALQHNVDLSGCQNVTAIRAAATDAPGEVTLYLAGLDTNSLLVSDGPSETVAAITLDSLPDSASATFVKIDVEGAELSVLRGATKLLGIGRAIFLLEANDEAAANELRLFMARHGYRLRQILDGRNYVFGPGANASPS